MRIISVLFTCSVIALTSFPTQAQSSAAQADRLNRLERDLNFLQRQVYGNDVKLPRGSTATAAAGSTQTLSELARLQEEVRKVRGSVERSGYENRRLADEFKRFSEDVDFRLQALEQAEKDRKNPDNGESRFSIDDGKTGAPGLIGTTDKTSLENAAISVVSADGTTSTNQPRVQKPTTNANNASAIIDTADNHYNNAFAMLNRKQYAEAAENFSAFIRKYPNDPLVANAYYWLGESHYARGDFVRAAEQFRKGYEVAPKGQKAADNLLKLGMSLGNVKRKEEACIVLQQVVTKFKTAATAATNARASEARAGLQCK